MTIIGHILLAMIVLLSVVLFSTIALYGAFISIFGISIDDLIIEKKSQYKKYKSDQLAKKSTLQYIRNKKLEKILK